MAQPAKHAAPPLRGAARKRTRALGSASKADERGRHRRAHQHPFAGVATSALRTTRRVVGAALLATFTAAAIRAGATTAGSTATAASSSTQVRLPEVVHDGTVPARALPARTVRISRDSSRQTLEESGPRVQPPGGAVGREENAELARLAASAEKVAGALLENAWQLPVVRGVYHLTARFGQCSGLWSHCHTGLDFAAPTGTPVHAVAGGTVTATGWAGAYGNRTVTRLEDGTEIWYCHQTAFAVERGDRVFAGQVIGSVGSTGNSTGPHLHLEVRPGGGDPVDPYEALSVRGQAP